MTRASSARTPGGSRVLRAAGEALLWIAAALGVLCVLLAVLGAGFGFRVVLFSSGSMSPTIPAGSAALVRTVDAADLRPGDVVTVERDGGRMPVTHRVVDVAAAGDPAVRTLTLKGDANADVDAETYPVAEAGRVVLSVPGVAPAVARLGDPRVLAPLGVVAAALVVWGLWPRRTAPRTPVGSAVPPPTPRPDATTPGHARTVGALAVVVPLALAGVVATPAPAGAADEHVVHGQHLRLTSVTADGAGRLAPGTSVDWVVGVAAPDAGDGTVESTLRVDGPLARHVRVAVESCPVRWVDGACEAAAVVVAPTAVAPGEQIDLGDQDARDERWLRVRVTLPDDAPDGTQSRSGTLRLAAHGCGESATVTPDGSGGSDGSDGSEGTDGVPVNPVGVSVEPPPTTGGDGWAGAPGVLPRTGAGPALWVAAALLAVVAGLAVRRRGRVAPAAVEHDTTDGRSES